MTSKFCMRMTNSRSGVTRIVDRKTNILVPQQLYCKLLCDTTLLGHRR